jgi:hypothetical protein
MTKITVNNSFEVFKSVEPKYLYFAVLGFAILFYAVSCAPGMLWQDSGMIQYRVWQNDIEGGLGLALSHPLFYLLAIGAKYIPVGEFIYKTNLVAAIAAAAAVANVFLLLRLWLGRNLPAIIAAMTLAFSHTFWCHGAEVETYTLYIALFTAELIMLLQYVNTRRVVYLCWLGLLNGLSVADHMLGTIPLLCYSIFFVILLINKGVRIRDLVIIVLLWVVGSLPYEYLIVRNILRTGDFAGVLASAAFGSSWEGAVLNTSMSLKIVKENILFFVMNFPTPNAALFVAGCFALFKLFPKNAFRNILIAVLILFFIFAFRYTIPDRYTFFMPFYCVVSIIIGVGADLFLKRVSRRMGACLVLLFAFLPIGVYAVLPQVAEKFKVNLGVKRTIPYRNEYKYFLQPWKTNYRGAERFAKEALESVDKNAIIYADGTTVYPLLLTQQIKGKREDVTIVSSHGTVRNLDKYGDGVIDKFFADNIIYVVSPVTGYCPKFLLEKYDFVKSGALYKVVKKK